MSSKLVTEIGARVMYCAAHLRSTGQYTGPEAPTSFGPFARGRLVEGGATLGGLDPVRFAVVRWEDGEQRPVLRSNLEATR